MTHRYLKALGREISAIGFGGWEIGGEATFGGKPAGWGRVPEAQAVRAVERALELGVNFFDTADIYGWGRSEELIGRVLARKGKAAVVCTKFGNRETRRGRVFQDFSEGWHITSEKGSIKRLRRESLDIIMLQNPPGDLDWADYDAAPLEELQQAGKIGAFGVSCHTPAGALRVLESGFGSVVEIIYNVLDRRAEQVVLPLAMGLGAAVIVRMPLASGFLTDMLGGRARFASRDHRAHLPRADVAWRLAARNKLAFLRALPGGMACSALRFCLSHSAVTTVIPGMRTVGEVEANVQAARLGSLNAAVLGDIAAAVPEPYRGW